jgi:RND family efflux transporter MFP subunit
LILSLLVLGCGKRDAQGTSQNQGQSSAGSARAVPVRIAEAKRGTISRSLAVSGVVEPIRTVGVNSQVSGALLSVAVEEGDAVRQGQILAQLDDREASTELAAAEAEYEVAQAAFERATQLRDRQVITLPEYERERTEAVAAQARRDQARTRLGYTTITAPISGVVTEKLVEAGDIVASQMRLFTVADLSTKVVLLHVSELDVVELSIGDRVQVMMDAFPDRELEGRIRRIFPGADPATRLVPVEVALSGDSAELARPGFLARVTFELGERDDVLLVPASAIVQTGGSPAVFVVEKERASRRPVSTGTTSRGDVEILEGLAESDSVITVGNTSLQDGALVRVVATEETPAAEADPS